LQLFFKKFLFCVDYLGYFMAFKLDFNALNKQDFDFCHKKKLIKVIFLCSYVFCSSLRSYIIPICSKSHVHCHKLQLIESPKLLLLSLFLATINWKLGAKFWETSSCRLNRFYYYCSAQVWRHFCCLWRHWSVRSTP